MGSRDEKSTENGTAHFIEHCLFKGTEKRKAFQILSCIDGVGGELNAFTTKEETCVYALYLQQYQERFLELLADIAFHSLFPWLKNIVAKSVFDMNIVLGVDCHFSP